MEINKLIDKGEDALKKRSYDYAISIFLEAVNFAPDNRRAREGLRRAELKRFETSYPSGFVIALTGMGARLGMMFSSMGKKKNPEPYMMACERYLAKHPKSLKVNLALGDAAEMGNYLEAAALAFETAAEHHPKSVTALKRLGNVLVKKREIQRAHEVFDKAVHLDPNDQEAIKSRKNVAAEASLKETGFETAKSSRDLVRDKGAAAKLEAGVRLHKTEDDLATERKAIEERLAKEPENPDLLADLAEIQEKAKDYEGAIKTMDKAIAKRPGDTGLEFKRGDLKIALFETHIYEAEKAGKKAETEAKQRELDRFTAEEFARRVKAYPTDMMLRFRLGEVQLKLGALDAAIAEFQHTVRDPKYKSESQLRMGRAFAAKGQYDLAISQLQKALEGQAGMTERVKEIHYVLGDVFDRSGKPAEAKAEFGRIYEVDIKFRDVSARLTKLASAVKDGENKGSLSLSE